MNLSNLAAPLAFWHYVQGLYTKYSSNPLKLAEDGGRILEIYLTLYTGQPTEDQIAKGLSDLDTLARGEA